MRFSSGPKAIGERLAHHCPSQDIAKRVILTKPQMKTGPIRILELRCADGSGGGPEKTILKGAALSDPASFEVTVCYLRSAKDSDDELSSRAAELRLNYLQISQLRPFDAHAWRSIRRIVADRGIDIVHSHDYKSNLIALWLARRERCIPLSTAHGWTGHTLRERWLYYPAERRLLLKRFAHVIAVSSEIRNTLLLAGLQPRRVETVLNGIDDQLCRRRDETVASARARWGAQADSIMVGAVGRLEPQKRFDVLLRAFAEAASRESRLRLVIAGEGSERSRLERLMTSLGLTDRCRLLGHCADVESVYHGLDLFVQSSDYEGTPNVVLEAMAYQVPVVATSAGGTAELLRDGIDGWVVPPGNEKRLAEVIVQVTRDPRERIARTRAARLRVESTLSFRERTRRLETIYRNLITKREGLHREHATLSS